jgi:hypothetical protein
MATLTHPAVVARERATAIPWYLWCAALAVTSVTIGAHWDVSWHRSIGRDTFWTPAHLAIYLCGVLAGIAFGYLILRTTFGRAQDTTIGAVRVLGFRGPLGAFIAAWGGIAMITSAPFDNWWHNAYGLDVKIVSPPHTLLMLGIFAVEIGSLFVITSEANRAGSDERTFRALQMLVLYVAGLMLLLAMFFRLEYTWDIYLHSAGAYTSVALGVPLYYATVWKIARHRWACTWMAAIYMAAMIAIILVLQLFPAEPKLGPVFQQITHFVPPPFPVLMIVPAVVTDLLWARIGERNKLLVSAISGPLFVLSLVAAEWPFADFLMTKAAHNPFFVAGYVDYGMRPWSHYVLRQFVDVQSGAALWSGLGMAMVYASVSVWLGLMLGDWMRKIQR